MNGIDILLIKRYIGNMCPSEIDARWEDMCKNYNNDKDTCLKCWKLALDKNYEK